MKVNPEVNEVGGMGDIIMTVSPGELLTITQSLFHLFLDENVNYKDRLAALEMRDGILFRIREQAIKDMERKNELG